LGKNLYISFVYAPPSTSPYVKNLDYDIFEKLQEDISLYSGDGNVILAGDLNAKTNTMRDYVTDDGDSHTPINDSTLYIHDSHMDRQNQDPHAVDAQGKKLLELCKSSRIRILNGRTNGDRTGKLTRYPDTLRESPSTLDYVLSDCEILCKIKSLTILPHFGVSDHECLSVSINTKFTCVCETDNTIVNKVIPTKYVETSLFTKRLKSREGKEKINNFLAKHKVVAHVDDINGMCLDFADLMSTLSTVTENHKKKRAKRRKQIGKQKAPWYSSECSKMKSRLNHAVRILRKKPFDKSAQISYVNARKSLKRICRASERKFRQTLTNKLLSIENHKPKEFWDLITKMRKWGGGEDGDSPIKPSEWQTHFQSLLNIGEEAPRDIIDDLNKLESIPSFSELDVQITTGDIKRALNRLNKNASPGPDRVHGKFIYNGKEDLMPALLLLLNKIFSHSIQPDFWSLNYLISIFKKGENWDPNNYRGIAIGSCLCKIFDLILLERLEKRTQMAHPISPNQIGFKAGHRTADHIFVINSLINKIIRIERKRIFVAFIDFRKAYDTVNRTLLLLKLQKLGINGLFYSNMKVSLNSISYLIKVNGGHLKPISSTVGLKQGGILSPLLFNIFIDDISKIFDDTCDPICALKQPLSHLLYADDLALLSYSQAGLNNCLSKLKEYCEKWKLGVNLTKSEVIVFNPSGRKLDNYNFKFGDLKMKIVKSYTYLGIEFLSSGSFWLAKSNLMDKARKAMFPLFSVISQFQLPCTKSIKLFHTLVRPICLYNAENWACFSSNQINKIKVNESSLLGYMTDSEPDKVFQRFIKFILGVNTSCTNVATLGEVGEFPMLLHALASLLKFWHRVSNMPEETLARQSLELQMQMGPDQSEWLGTVKLLLSLLGLDNHFQNTKLLSNALFAETCTKQLRRYFINLWKVHISGTQLGPNISSKLRFYKLFKTAFEREPYLDLISNFQLRKVISKFRCSDHRLEIEKGRHDNVNVEDRICRICNMSVENEFHFLKFCYKYSALRTRYFGHFVRINDWLQIIKCKDRHTAYKFGNFLSKALKLREQHLDRSLNTRFGETH
jgi:hypothetical protein